MEENLVKSVKNVLIVSLFMLVLVDFWEALGTLGSFAQIQLWDSDHIFSLETDVQGN